MSGVIGALVLIGTGIYSFGRLPVDAYPDLSPPMSFWSRSSALDRYAGGTGGTRCGSRAPPA